MAEKSNFLKFGKRSIEITNEDKVLFPKSKISKIDIIEYYKSISKFMIPLVKNRPITMFRYPNGIQKEFFVQKNVSDYFPSWVKTVAVPRKEQSSIKMVICNNVATLVYLANQACITPHIWLSQIDQLNIPDRLIFDLDPPRNNFPLVVQGAKALKDLLEHTFHLHPFIMTTGSRGVHIVVPIKREFQYLTVKAFAKQVAKLLIEQHPDKYTIEPRKNKRRGRLFIDYLRNAYAQTAVAPYSIRALEKAPVATPIQWKELTSNLDVTKFNIKTVLKRDNPWKGINQKSKSLRKFIKTS